MTPFKRCTAAGGALVLAVTLAACGGSDTNGTGGTATAPDGSATEVSEVHNEADVAFAQGMIPHHRQAIEMASLAMAQAASEDVRQLAEEISAAQGPEIETMTTFLQTWGAEVPDDMAGMGHMDMGDMPMSGMMSPEQMAQLEAAEGADFDRMFLQMMTEHHQGAVEMAQVEQEEGENPQAIDLAEEIEATQMEEIERMQEFLGSI